MKATPIAFLAGGGELRKSAPEAVRAVIFDLDGTLIDSEENHYESDRVLLARRGNVFFAVDAPENGIIGAAIEGFRKLAE